ncbi:hypothetical protein AN963_21300 [Brevibacillus choshinensis]|uniref:3-oxoacyl-ACP reductase n=1 Tax=Brevibacillus choshinensis TaxID=54911 RepID=A0ABR5N0F0_BRECH|nr:hypothetical protein AN963_21300 [Brevibacillus choshinensis]
MLREKTSAGRGVGQGIALAMAKEGANVAVVDMNAENAESTAQQLRCRTAVFLASQDSDYITGQTIMVDGGGVMLR